MEWTVAELKQTEGPELKWTKFEWKRMEGPKLRLDAIGQNGTKQGLVSQS